MLLSLYRYKKVLIKMSTWVKLKPLSTQQGQQVENEDPTISGEERVEVKGLVVTEEDGN